MKQVWSEAIQNFLFSITFDPLAVFLESMEERGHWRRHSRCFIAMSRCPVTSTRGGNIWRVSEAIFAWSALKPEALKIPNFVVTYMIFG